MIRTRSPRRFAVTLLLFLGVCAPETPPEPASKELERLKLEWETRIQESEKTAKQRAGLLPDLLDAFASKNAPDWHQAKTSLHVLEKQQKGFVYTRILELLDPALQPGEAGERAREELAEIGRIIRLANRLDPDTPADWKEARAALESLGSKGIDAAAVRLILNFRTHDPEILARVQEELLTLGMGAVRHLALAIRSPGVSPYIKERCVETLVRIGTPAAPALLPLLEEPGRSGRYFAAKALGKINDPGVLPALAKAEAKEEDPLVRCVMLEALATLGGPEPVKAAIRALSAEDLSVVKFGAKALARLNASEGLPALVDALERAQDPSSRDVRQEILAALRLITGLPGGSDPAWWRERLPR